MGHLPKERRKTEHSASGRSRVNSTPAEALEQGVVRLDLPNTRAFVDGREVRMPLAQFRILERLLEEPGHTVTRAELIQAAFGEATNDRRDLDHNIVGLRGKLGREHGKRIKLVYGVGYCFSPDNPRLTGRSATPTRPAPEAPVPEGATVNGRRSTEAPAMEPHPPAFTLRPESIARRLPEPVWALFESALPPAPISVDRGLRVSNHRVLHALLYVLLTGIDWELVPPCFPSARTIRRRLKDWLRSDDFHAAWAQLARWCVEFAGVDWNKVMRQGGNSS